jgi:hypothetical protein
MTSGSAAASSSEKKPAEGAPAAAKTEEIARTTPLGLGGAEDRTDLRQPTISRALLSSAYQTSRGAVAEPNVCGI